MNVVNVFLVYFDGHLRDKFMTAYHMSWNSELRVLLAVEESIGEGTLVVNTIEFDISKLRERERLRDFSILNRFRTSLT